MGKEIAITNLVGSLGRWSLVKLKKWVNKWQPQTWLVALEDEACFQFFKLEKGLKKGITNLVGRLGRLLVSLS